jgi:hypothetical protein
MVATYNIKIIFNLHTSSKSYWGNLNEQSSVFKKKTPLTIIPVLRVFVASGKCLPSRCLATVGVLHIQTNKLMRGIYEACL